MSSLDISWVKQTDIKELTLDRLMSWLKAEGIEPYRAKQIFKSVYIRQVDSFDKMTDLGKEVRRLLSAHFTINRLTKSKIETSTDGAKKYLFQLNDGQYIESVLIPEKKHYTLCVSTQVGCALGCRFCLTANGGFSRNLTMGEIISQVRDIENEAKGKIPLTNIVFMGMGEPLANYNNLVNAVNIITDKDYGLRFSHRKVTISTAGFVPRIYDMSRDTKVNLAVSLNASNNRTRSFLMPINKKYPIEKLIIECRRYRLAPHRKITFEYILIRGINDSTEDANRLARLLRPVRSKINLIPYNEHKGNDFKRPDQSVINSFSDILLKNGHTAIIRKSKGEDISAACGQLSRRITDLQLFSQPIP